jgi:hypothetical protein
MVPAGTNPVTVAKPRRAAWYNMEISFAAKRDVP